MKLIGITTIVLVTAVVLFLVYLAYLGLMSRSGTITGLIDGKLAACPDKPNCVCSEYPHDTDHAIEPIAMHDPASTAVLQKLKDIIEAQGGTISITRENYIAATFSSAIFGFVDDLEIRTDAKAGVVHLRSASRVGNSDFGVNSRRVDMIEKMYSEKQ